MKKVLVSVVVISILASASMFAMDKLSPAVKNKLTQVAGQGQAKFEAYVRANAIPVTWSEYQTFLAKPVTGEAIAPLRGEVVQPKTTAVASKVDRNAIIKEVLPIETAFVTDDLIIDLLRHPLLGTNKEDAIATIEALRKALVGKEQDPRIQALPTRAEFFTRMQTAPKRDLTYDEANFLTKAAKLKKSADVYAMYLQLHPDITFDDEFLKLMQEAATGKIILLSLDYSKFKVTK